MNEKYDYVIVGTSFSSSFFLRKLLENSSKKDKILVLERGHMYSHKDRLENRRNQIFGKPEKPAKIIKSEAAYERGTGSEWKRWLFQLGFGGGSNCWHACTPRMMPNDFKMKSEYGLADDWPVTYEELEPYYEEAEQIMSISGPDDVPWPKQGKYPQSPHVFSTVDRILKKEYGGLYFQQPTARARQATGQRGVCCSNNECYLCPVDAKFTIENGLKYLYQNSEVELRYGANVTHVELSNNLAKGIHYTDSNGDTVYVEANAIVLGANAIFNAGILLKSGDNSRWLGRGITEQAAISVDAILDKFNNVGASTIVSAIGHMLYDGEHRTERAACMIESNNDFGFKIRKGESFRSQIENWRSMANFRVILESIPNKDDFISISQTTGKPVINYKKRSDYTINSVSAIKKEVERVLSVLPLKYLEFSDDFFDTEAHILCSHRMSEKPEDGVVDKNLIHHKYRNLFVLGGGAFVTCAPANPTLTISALSLRSADNI